MKVLITGGAGFIGSHLCDRLIDLAHQVTIIDSEATGASKNVHPQARYIRGDILDPGALAVAFDPYVDVVFHVAAQMSTRVSYRVPEGTMATNSLGTLRVLQQCMARGVPRLLYASSVTAYGDLPEGPASETAPCAPLSYYGITKYAAERYVHCTAARTDLAHPLDVTSFRMFAVYGPRQRIDGLSEGGVVGVFLGNLLRGDPLTLYGDGEQTRDFIYVDDVVDAWLAAIDPPQAFGQVFNLGTGKSTTILRLIEMLKAQTGRGHDFPIVRKPTCQGDQRHGCANIDKAQRLLGWAPQVSLEEGVGRTVAWAREHL